jgi:hypothetical protein
MLQCFADIEEGIEYQFLRHHPEQTARLAKILDHIVAEHA